MFRLKCYAVSLEHVSLFDEQMNECVFNDRFVETIFFNYGIDGIMVSTLRHIFRHIACTQTSHDLWPGLHVKFIGSSPITFFPSGLPPFSGHDGASPIPIKANWVYRWSVCTYVCRLSQAIASAIIRRSSPNLAQTTRTRMGRTSSLEVKIGNQLPVLCACAVKSHVKVWQNLK